MALRPESPLLLIALRANKQAPLPPNPITLQLIALQGILWSGREELFRARAFLLAALQAHELLGQRLKEKQPAPAAAAAAAADAADAESGAAFRRPLQGAYTHTLFYLAQVYGALGDAAASAGYCYRTLAEQVRESVGWLAGL